MVKTFQRCCAATPVDEPQEEPIAMMPQINRRSDDDYSDIEIVPLVPNTSPSWWGEWRGIRTPQYTYAVQFHEGEVRQAFV